MKKHPQKMASHNCPYPQSRLSVLQKKALNAKFHGHGNTIKALWIAKDPKTQIKPMFNRLTFVLIFTH